MKMSEVQIGTVVVDRTKNRFVKGTITKKTSRDIYVKWHYANNPERLDVEHAEQFLEVHSGNVLHGRTQMINKSVRKAKLSPAMQKALTDFDTAARAWGWESDQGYGIARDETEKQYEKAKQELHDKILQLQQRLKTASKQKESK